MPNGEEATIDFTTNNTLGVTTYDWSATGDIIGLPDDTLDITNSDADITFTASNPDSEPREVTITVTPIFTNDGVACVTDQVQTFTITVNPTTNVTAFDDQFIFTGETTESVTIESVTENVTFTWTAVAESGIEGLVNTSGSTNIIPAETLTLAEGINTPLDVVYTIIPSAPAGENDNDCPGNPYTYTVTVNPFAQLNELQNIVVCHDTQVGPIAFTTNLEGGITTYDWIASGDDVGLTQTDDGTGIINQFPAQNITSEP